MTSPERNGSEPPCVSERQTLYRLRIVKETNDAYRHREPAREPGATERLIRKLIGDPHQEIFGVLLLDVRHRLIGHVVTHMGTTTRIAVETRDVLLPALLACATKLIAFHNHPSGDPTPSLEDVTFTRQLAEAGELLRVELADHLVLGEPGRFVSMRERLAW